MFASFLLAWGFVRSEEPLLRRPSCSSVALFSATAFLLVSRLLLLVVLLSGVLVVL